LSESVGKVLAANPDAEVGVGVFEIARQPAALYVEHADDQVMAWAMIETADALDNLDDITLVQGLDGVYVGPGDLAMSLGERPREDVLPDPVWDALEQVARAARNAGILSGVYCADLPNARRLAEMGYNLITPGNDIVLLRDAATRRIAALR
jgi:4-hydroxy-2-oxoheptanedioate aldolase